MAHLMLHSPEIVKHDDVTSTQSITKADSYSDDFENDSITASHNNTTLRYSDDFEGSPNSNTLRTQYSDDFEECSRSNSRTTASSDDYTSASKSRNSLGRYTNSVSEISEASTSGTLQDKSLYSDREDTETDYSTRTSLSYSDSFESGSYDTSVSTSYHTSQYTEDFQDTTERSVSTSTITRTTDNESTSYQSTWADSSELSEATSEATYLAEHNFINRIINQMKGKQSKEVLKEEVGNEKRDMVKMSEEQMSLERETMKKKKAFCRKLIRNIEANKNARKVKEEGHSNRTKLELLGIKEDRPFEEYGLSCLIINKLKLENTINKYKELVKEPIHQPQKCTYCVQLLELLATETFIKDKFHVALNHMIDSKLDIPNALSTNLLTDPVVLPGRLQKNLSHLSPQAIWRQLVPSDSEGPEETILDCKTDSVQIGDFTEEKCPADIHTMISQLQMCPHLQASNKHTTPNIDDTDERIEEYIKKTQNQVDQVKQDLLSEREALLNLSPKDFWKKYFSKLKR